LDLSNSNLREECPLDQESEEAAQERVVVSANRGVPPDRGVGVSGKTEGSAFKAGMAEAAVLRWVLVSL
jgi:hypothetical protein